MCNSTTGSTQILWPTSTMENFALLSPLPCIRPMYAVLVVRALKNPVDRCPLTVYGRSWLSAQERLAVDSAATQTIASPTRSIASSTTSTESSSDSEKSGSKISKKKRKLGLMGLLSVVALLCGTNVYSWRQSQAWKVI